MYSIQNSDVNAKEQETEKNNSEYLRVDDLVTKFYTTRGIVKAIDGVSFSIRRGEIFGLVGESGCGKSVTASSVMDLIPDPPGRIVSGKIFIDDFNIIGDIDKLASINVKSETSVKIKRNKKLIKRHNTMLSRIRGRKVGMIFQEPSLALNPVITVGDQIIENIMLHNRASIADSVIRRANLQISDIEKLVTSIPEDSTERRSFINKWTRENGLPEIEKSLVQIFTNYTDSREIRDQVINLIKGQEFHNIDVAAIQTAKEFFNRRDQILDLNLKIIESEYKKDQEKVSLFSSELEQLNKETNSQFAGYKLKRRFLGKRMDHVFKLEARRRAKELLTLVNLPDPDRILDSYPHELSGGMQQRAMIAMALASNPKLLIADEPTTALDVTTQAQILTLIRSLNEVIDMSVLFITHDLAVIAEMCQRVAVMYAGNIVEEAPVEEIFKDPKHPYSTGLLSSIPRMEDEVSKEMKLDTIPGSVPNLITPPSGCRFHPRCKFKMDICEEKKPKLVDLGNNHKVACFLYSKEEVVSNA